MEGHGVEASKEQRKSKDAILSFSPELLIFLAMHVKQGSTCPASAVHFTSLRFRGENSNTNGASRPSISPVVLAAPKASLLGRGGGDSSASMSRPDATVTFSVSVDPSLAIAQTLILEGNRREMNKWHHSKERSRD